MPEIVGHDEDDIRRLHTPRLCVAWRLQQEEERQPDIHLPCSHHLRISLRSAATPQVHAQDAGTVTPAS